MITAICHSQLCIINRDFEMYMIVLYNEYNFAKNHDKRKSYHFVIKRSYVLRVNRKKKDSCSTKAFTIV